MRALIVCADLEARSELIEALRARFSVDVAAGAAEGRRYISASLEKDRRYSLVVLDYDVPDGSAEEALALLRREEEARGLTWPRTARVIVLSRSEKKIVGAFFKGSEAGMTMPVDRVNLLKQIEALEVDKV